MLKTLANLAAGLAIACTPIPHPDNPDGGDDPDGGSATCATLCANLRDRLKCPGAEGSPGPDDVTGTADDETCEATCGGLIAGGARVDLECGARARTCAESDACYEGDE